MFKSARTSDEFQKATDLQLDFALVRSPVPCTDPMPMESTRPQSVVEGEEVFIIGHPFGGFKRVAAGKVSRVNDFCFEYGIPTTGGVSGSPVFNKR